MRLLAPISSTTLVVRNPTSVDAEIDDEIVVLSIAEGTCYGMNEVGSRIWKLTAGPIRVRDICTTLLAEYRVEPSTCEHQVLDLLEELRTEGLIRTLEEE